MKQLACEMCGSTDMMKQDGFFICQNCSTKYSVEEARKMMGVEGDVAEASAVNGNFDKLEKLYQIARRAKDDDNDENAAKYYEMIMIEDPLSWEASFYTVYYSAKKCKIAEIGTAATKVAKTITTVLRLIKETVEGEEAQKAAYNEVANKVELLGAMLFIGAKNHYDGISYQVKSRFTAQYASWVISTADMLYSLGDELKEFFGDRDDITTLCVSAWKNGTNYQNALVTGFININGNKSVIKKYEDKICEFDSGYTRKVAVNPDGTVAGNTSSGGCYVATAVYGSYDCPEVWTLRRFRDNTLAETWYGRAFIHTYYAVSPTLVKWFGHTEWFKNMWRGKLDRMVKNLQDQGVEDTPYDDKQW